ncbi:creatinase/aminopeptidase [Phanerochaete sordida]|uniref:Creatinase/aminopeptidase n=1 Tax=Phanerochaete sordida TaxID=48140 RepID=A0A9P3LI10_9APHY|nr:creatinase/aminopeptidase [Phanerochaete sordida]
MDSSPYAMAGKGPAAVPSHDSGPRSPFRPNNHKRTATAAMAFLTTALFLLLFRPSLRPAPPPPPFAHLAAYCAHVPPPPPASFVARQDTLAATLTALGAAAYVAEPGASAAFFANLSGDAWHLSERPLLLLVTPAQDAAPPAARLTVLTPAFEASRARLLPVPAGAEVLYPAWPEDADPYEVAVAALPGLRGGTLFVDGAMRQFVVDGLRRAAGPGATVVSAPPEVRRLRERKSREEIEILKCANEATLEAIRAARDEMYIGMRESEARGLVESALASTGLKHGGGLVLFGPNAALPHGSGTDRRLRKRDMVLVDVGASLHGYVSDVTRTFALEDSAIPMEHLDIWSLVWTAQTLAFAAARNDTVAAHVDRTARRTIEAGGYGPYFTHRLGHGIGLEGHEAPYLRGGSEDIILTGHTFSDEPGVYIEGEVGVRLEDCFYVDDDGRPVFLTAGVGGQAGSAWEP